MKSITMKKALAIIAALSITAGLAACDDSGSDPGSNGGPQVTTATTPPREMDEEDKAAVAEIDMGDDVQKLENGTVRWLSHWDLNPEDGKPKGVDIELFETNYGGKIEYLQTTWETRWDTFSTLVVSADPPDLFPGGELDVFPGRAINGMFQPMDDYLDFDSDMWTDSAKKLSDEMTLGGKHYVAVTNADTVCLCIYNKRVIEENGLDDPAELLKEGNWTWDTFKDMCLDFIDPDEEKVALDGWWFEHNLILTTGKPAIGMENGTIVSNLMSPEMERAQAFMLEVNRNGFNIDRAKYNWTEQKHYVGEGKVLFYPVGVWQLYEPDLSVFGDEGEIMFVPMPRDPSADEYYIPVSTGIDSFVLCKGAPNPEGAAAFIKCRLMSVKDENAKAIKEKQLREDYHWTDDMVEMWDLTIDLLNQHPVIEYFPGVSVEINSALNDPLKQASYSGTDWATTRSGISDAVQTYIDNLNVTIANDFS
ncbi:MAG: extracellular solute-binding protein [Oscillospiraceae bacterium]|nr:extracellular solute-binding protein [Oscillospiraceae bacterium]